MLDGSIFDIDYSERFEWPEYLVFVALLVVSMGVGIFYGCIGNKNRTNEDFLMAGRSMPVFPVTLSVICSFVSAITLLGNPVEIYFYGIQYVSICISFVWMSIALAYLYVPVYYNLHLTSVFEYFELRFNRKVRVLISMSQIIHTFLYMPTTVYGPALALDAVAGINGLLTSAIIFIVCVGYSSIGGLKAVLWTDAIQAFVMLASLISVIGVGVSKVGGFDVVWQRAQDTGRTNFFNFDVDPRTRHTFWTGLIGSYFNWIPLFAATQAQIQRYLSVPTLAKARLCIWMNMVGLISIVILCSLTGLVIFGKYYDCDPITIGKIKNSDQLLPLFVMDMLGEIPVLPGLFVAGLTAGSLSTVSSALNSLAAIVTEDYVKKYRPNLSDEKLGLVSKIVSLVGGLIAFGLIFVIASAGNILPFASILHATFIAPIFAAFTLGMFFPWANWMGIILGIPPSVALTLFVGIGSIVSGNAKQLPDQKLYFGNSSCYPNQTYLYDPITIEKVPVWKQTEYSAYIDIVALSYQWQPVIPCVCTVVFGLIFSLIYRQFNEVPLPKEKYFSIPVLNMWRKILGEKRLNNLVDFTEEKPQQSLVINPIIGLNAK